MNGLDCFRRFPGLVLANAPDAAGGGGGQAPSGAAPDGAPTQDAPSGDPPSALAADGDDGDELEALLDDADGGEAPTGPVDPQRFTSLRAAHNKLKRRFGKAAPTLRALREAGVKNVGDLLTKARQYDELQGHVEKNPKLRAVLFGEPEPTAAPTTPENDAFDRSKLPFPVSEDDPLSMFMAALAEQVHDLKRENGQLRQTVQTDLTGRQQASERRDSQAWKTATEAAEQELPQHMRRFFRDAMVTAFRERHRHRLPVEKVIEHYLGDHRKAGKTSATTTRVATAAAAERGAANNTKNWPAHMAGGGAPAPANRTPSRLADVHKRVRTLGA